MGFATIEISTGPAALTITLARPDAGNGIDATMVSELHAALDQAEADPECRLVVLAGRDGVFCTGMDVVGAGSTGRPTADAAARGGAEFLGLLKRLTTLPRVVVSTVDGRVLGGGVGLTAASDFTFATPRSTFGLPEALWGLLPCCVTPFLIRRVGFQRAYSMSLSTQPVTGEVAYTWNLVDQLGEDLDGIVRRLTFRVTKLDPGTIGDLKRYFGRMWFLDADMEQAAVDEFARLLSSGPVGQRLSDFAHERRYPWEA